MVDDDLESTLERARRAAPGFGLARQQRVIWRVRRGLRPNWSTRRLFVGFAAACLAGVALAVLSWSGLTTSDGPIDERWQLRDGSRIVIETPETRITKQRDSDSEVLFELRGGAARFDVAPRPERAFRVQAGPVLVEVLGTSFRLERRGERTLVAVERGRVAVSWSGARQELTAGQHGSFPPERTESSQVFVPPSVDAAPSLRVEPATAPSASLLPDSSANAARPNAEALFALADRARLEGRTLEATRALRQLTQRFPRDARAPLAAFTLGRLLLESRQAADAARAFELARSLAGSGSALSEDALAREVEAWRAAGDAGKAAARARHYRTLYPNGAHVKQVARAGELSTGP